MLLLDPAGVVEALDKAGRVDKEWKATYDARRLQTGEKAGKANVVPLMPKISNVRL